MAVPAPQITKDMLEVTQRAPERMHERVGDQTVDLAAPLILEKIVEAIQRVSLEDRIGGCHCPRSRRTSCKLLSPCLRSVSRIVSGSRSDAVFWTRSACSSWCNGWCSGPDSTETVELLQVQFLDKGVDAPGVVHVKRSSLTWWSKSLLCRSMGDVQFLDKVVDMPVGVQPQMPGWRVQTTKKNKKNKKNKNIKNNDNDNDNDSRFSCKFDQQGLLSRTETTTGFRTWRRCR